MPRETALLSRNRFPLSTLIWNSDVGNIQAEDRSGATQSRVQDQARQVNACEIRVSLRDA